MGQHPELGNVSEIVFHDETHLALGRKSLALALPQSREGRLRCEQTHQKQPRNGDAELRDVARVTFVGMGNGVAMPAVISRLTCVRKNDAWCDPLQA
jgi:hypothetical protein